VLFRLVREADVIVENSSRCNRAGWGSITRPPPRQPRLIYCSITGYGSTGLSATEAFDLMVQAPPA